MGGGLGPLDRPFEGGPAARVHLPAVVGAEQAEGIGGALHAEGPLQDALVVDMEALFVEQEDVERELPLHQRQPRQAQAGRIVSLPLKRRQPVAVRAEREDLDLVDPVDPDAEMERDAGILALPLDLQLPGLEIEWESED